jgi:hypothetical protein
VRLGNLPRAPALVSLGMRKNFWKTLAWYSGGTPGPWSMTLKRIV